MDKEAVIRYARRKLATPGTWSDPAVQAQYDPNRFPFRWHDKMDHPAQRYLEKDKRYVPLEEYTKVPYVGHYVTHSPSMINPFDFRRTMVDLMRDGMREHVPAMEATSARMILAPSVYDEQDRVLLQSPFAHNISHPDHRGWAGEHWHMATGPEQIDDRGGGESYDGYHSETAPFHEVQAAVAGQRAVRSHIGIPEGDHNYGTVYFRNMADAEAAARATGGYVHSAPLLRTREPLEVPSTSTASFIHDARSGAPVNSENPPTIHLYDHNGSDVLVSHGPLQRSALNMHGSHFHQSMMGLEHDAWNEEEQGQVKKPIPKRTRAIDHARFNADYWRTLIPMADTMRREHPEHTDHPLINLLGKTGPLSGHTHLLPPSESVIRSTSVGSELYDHALKNPKDHTARLVLADHLRDQGHDDAAGFFESTIPRDEKGQVKMSRRGDIVRYARKKLAAPAQPAEPFAYPPDIREWHDDYVFPRHMGVPNIFQRMNIRYFFPPMTPLPPGLSEEYAWSGHNAPGAASVPGEVHPQPPRLMMPNRLFQSVVANHRVYGRSPEKNLRDWSGLNRHHWQDLIEHASSVPPEAVPNGQHPHADILMGSTMRNYPQMLAPTLAKITAAPHGKELYDHAVANPNDHSIRMVLADHLEESGDQDSAGFFRSTIPPAPKPRKTSLSRRGEIIRYAREKLRYAAGDTPQPRRRPVAAPMSADSFGSIGHMRTAGIGKYSSPDGMPFRKPLRPENPNEYGPESVPDIDSVRNSPHTLHFVAHHPAQLSPLDYTSSRHNDPATPSDMAYLKRDPSSGGHAVGNTAYDISQGGEDGELAHQVQDAAWAGQRRVRKLMGLTGDLEHRHPTVFFKSHRAAQLMAQAVGGHVETIAFNPRGLAGALAATSKNLSGTGRYRPGNDSYGNVYDQRMGMNAGPEFDDLMARASRHNMLSMRSAGQNSAPYTPTVIRNHPVLGEYITQVGGGVNPFRGGLANFADTDSPHRGMMFHERNWHPDEEVARSYGHPPRHDHMAQFGPEAVQLHRAFLANPDDHLARAVLADHLNEIGQHDLADLFHSSLPQQFSRKGQIIRYAREKLRYSAGDPPPASPDPAQPEPSRVAWADPGYKTPIKKYFNSPGYITMEHPFKRTEEYKANIVPMSQEEFGRMPHVVHAVSHFNPEAPLDDDSWQAHMNGQRNLHAIVGTGANPDTHTLLLKDYGAALRLAQQTGGHVNTYAMHPEAWAKIGGGIVDGRLRNAQNQIGSLTIRSSRDHGEYVLMDNALHDAPPRNYRPLSLRGTTHFNLMEHRLSQATLKRQLAEQGGSPYTRPGSSMGFFSGTGSTRRESPQMRERRRSELHGMFRQFVSDYWPRLVGEQTAAQSRGNSGGIHAHHRLFNHYGDMRLQDQYSAPTLAEIRAVDNGEELYRQALTNRRDPMPRMVLSDLLDQQGNTNAASFFRNTLPHGPDGQVRFAKGEAKNPFMGINIRDSDDEPFTDWILDGKKTVETRGSNSLHPYLGRRVGIIRTRKKYDPDGRPLDAQAHLVGFATIHHEPVEYRTAEDFRADEDRHQVAEGSEHDWKGHKWGYVLKGVSRLKTPRPVGRGGIVARKLNYRRDGAMPIRYNRNPFEGVAKPRNEGLFRSIANRVGAFFSPMSAALRQERGNAAAAQAATMLQSSAAAPPQAPTPGITAPGGADNPAVVDALFAHPSVREQARRNKNYTQQSRSRKVVPLMTREQSDQQNSFCSQAGRDLASCKDDGRHGPAR